MDSKFLCLIPLYQLGNNWQGVQVKAIDNEKFEMVNPFSLYKEKLVFTDEELKPDKTGKVIIDLSPLGLKAENNGYVTPKTFEMPAEILAARKEKRRLNALAKNAISIIPYQNESMYFHLENEKLRICQGEREAIVDKIEVIHGKKAVNVESLELGHPYMELPADVLHKFEKVLQEKKLRDLTLVPAGKSLLNGLEYHRLNMDIPGYMWSQVSGFFENFGKEGDMTGFLTCQPDKVAEILGITY